MRKIISLFRRNYDGDHFVFDEIVPGAEWVQAGEGIATRKWDGTCCAIRGGQFFKRYDGKSGKTPPAGFEPTQEPDPVTGHWPGWLPVGSGPENRWHWEAIDNWKADIGGFPPDGTYELIGPKIQGNPEKLTHHSLVAHGTDVLLECPTGFGGLRLYLSKADIEGIVWHHPDGRMVKIKGRDFGLKRCSGQL
jgi:hypothetical protein